MRFRVRERIVFCGFVERVNEVYAALDAFLFPSLEIGKQRLKRIC